MPLKVSVVDMIEIGAGGGSLARVDSNAALMKVGPRSEGSVPGPVCYGRGGEQPTLTDADLVLGRLDPDYFLGGELALDIDRVRRAFQEKISAGIAVSGDEAALGVQRIVDEMMAAATRMHLTEKGRDPRDYVLIAFGGAGPVHAFNLAKLLKVKRILVPLGAGVASALGFLVAPPATDMVRTEMSRLESIDWMSINRHFAEMRAAGEGLLTEAGTDPERIVYRPSAEMRHVGQGFEISIELPALELSGRHLPIIRARFLQGYQARSSAALWRRARSKRSTGDSPAMRPASISVLDRLTSLQRPVSMQRNGACGRSCLKVWAGSTAQSTIATACPLVLLSWDQPWWRSASPPA
jgi:N-methylhydantoinase A